MKGLKSALDEPDVVPAVAVKAAYERLQAVFAELRGTDEVDRIVELRESCTLAEQYARKNAVLLDPTLVGQVAELSRRMDRETGLAIRRAQDTGKVALRAENLRNHGRKGTKRAPRDIVPGNWARTYAYGLAALTDEQFEGLVADAHRQRMYTREFFLGKARYIVATQGNRPEHLRGMRRPDSNRIVEQAVTASGLDQELAFAIDWDALDRDRLEGWISSLTAAIGSLLKLRRQLTKELTREQP